MKSIHYTHTDVGGAFSITFRDREQYYALLPLEKKFKHFFGGVINYKYSKMFIRNHEKGNY